MSFLFLIKEIIENAIISKIKPMLVVSDSVCIPPFIPPLTIISACWRFRTETIAPIIFISLSNIIVGFCDFFDLVYQILNVLL